jgi:cytochrome P450
MIEAGSETTSQALNNTIVGLLSNPDAVRKCHEELDRVVGENRTPTFEDLPNLPYIWALVKVFSSVTLLRLGNHALETYYQTRNESLCH